MKTPAARRSLLLFTALALSLAATGWLAAQEQDVGAAAEAAAARPASREAVPAAAEVQSSGDSDIAALRLEDLRRQGGDATVNKELFAAHTWQAPPAPTAAVQPPQPVAAPDLPFTYLGKMLYAGTTTVFLSWQDRRFTVKAGDLIDGSYRVDSINGSLMTLTYLPLDIQQTMHIGDTN